MDLLTQDFPEKFINPSELPCISLYQPTHRSHPDKEQDVIRFKNLIKEIENSLEKKYPEKKVQSLLKPFHSLAEDFSFWTHNSNGLAILANTQFFKVYKLRRSVPELTVVADSFHIKPLIRIMQSADRYQLLVLNRQHVELFEGNRDELEKIELENDFPSTISKALGEELTHPYVTAGNYGMGPKGPSMHHGHGGKKDEIDIDTERFFRVIDQATLEIYSQASKLPLLLVALPEYHHLFHKISKNPFLIKNGIQINADDLPIEELCEQAWKHIEPYYLEKLDTLIKRFHEAQSNKLGSDILKNIAKAAVSGQISTLLIDADRQVAGQINDESGDINLNALVSPDTDDLLDDLAELVLKTKGEVVIVPSERMPTNTGAAAVFRYE
jgi:hypothetical protein